jgi:hypothetical protein
MSHAPGQQVPLQQVPWQQVPLQQTLPSPQLVALQTQVPLPLQSGRMTLHLVAQVWFWQVRHWLASHTLLSQQMPVKH